MLTKIKAVLLLSIIVPLFVGCGGGKLQAEKRAQVVMSKSWEVAKELPNNIVLLLPLKGGIAADSQAIRNGFLAAYDYSRRDHSTIKIKVVDTGGEDIQELYKQVVADGADVVVGPLTKKEVESIAKIGSLPIPVIALNTLDNYVHNFIPNLYQFGLLLQDEAVQVATKMVSERYDRAAIIVPQNSWGDKIATIFKHRYETAGGRVVATLNYSSATLPEQVCSFLAQDPAKLCVVQKHKDTGVDVSSKTERRQDINSIFLVANAAEARQIIPLLKFYYAGDLPIYSTSAIYVGTPSPSVDQDIDGVYFCDMPWILKAPSFLSNELQAIHGQIMALWGDSYAGYGRLYALGIDAYNLSLRLREFLSAPHSGFDGASGVLYLDSFNHIYRELQWAQMQNGVAVVLH